MKSNPRKQLNLYPQSVLLKDISQCTVVSHKQRSSQTTNSSSQQGSGVCQSKHGKDDLNDLVQDVETNCNGLKGLGSSKKPL